MSCAYFRRPKCLDRISIVLHDSTYLHCCRPVARERLVHHSILPHVRKPNLMIKFVVHRTSKKSCS